MSQHGTEMDRYEGQQHDERNNNPFGVNQQTNTVATGGGGDQANTPKTAALTRSQSWSVKDSDYDQGYKDAVITEGTIIGQFLGTVKKNVVLKLRDPCNLILEIMLPVIVVLLTMLLYLVISDASFPGANFVDINKYQLEKEIWSSYRKNLCTNETLPTGVNSSHPQWPNCSSLVLAGVINGSQLAGMYPLTDYPKESFECYPQTNNTICMVDRNTMSNVVRYWMYNKGAKDTLPLEQMIIWMLTAKTVFPPWLQENDGEPMSQFGKVHFIGPEGADSEFLLLAEFRKYCQSQSTLFDTVAGLNFLTGNDANAYAILPEQEGTNWGFVEFGKFSETNFELILHFNRSAIPSTTEAYTGRSYSGGLQNTEYFKYQSSGFMTWQKLGNEFYYHYYNKTAPIAPASGPMPYVDWTNVAFLSGAGTLFPLLIVFSFLYPVSQQCKRLVEEKEKRIREAMMIMGLGSGSFYLSHWLTYNLVYLVTALISSTILKLTVFNKSDFFITFFLFYFFCLSCISLASLLSSVFSKSRLAALISPVLFFMISIPFFAVENVDGFLLIIFALLGPSAFAMGVTLQSQYEIGSGMALTDIASPEDTPFNMAFVWFWLLFDTVLYFMLALWMDNILPSEWGTQEHCCFCYVRAAAACRDTRAVEGDENDGRDPNGQYEPEPRGRPSVALRGLRKEFTRGKERFVACNDLTFNMYEGQISVILGHNGAGKTTAINLMTGMLAPDSGYCLVYGKSILNDMRGVRQEIGFCPQHNILWEEMTCREHLEYFAKLKGLDGPEREDAVMEMIRAVDLENKLEDPAGSLSGGMKRKLSVAIAFVGRSRVVFLDEPTAGMDVAARRHTWDLIKAMAPGRTIVLTTHYMDEADLLGNQIAIMSKGRLKCKGAPLFLKTRLGVGYTLNCTIEAAADVEAITNAVTTSVPEADTLSAGSGEVSFRLPMEYVPRFPDMLGRLEDNMQQMGVKGFGISVTTIEEVFLKIGHDEEEAEIADPKSHKEGEEEEGAVVVDEDAWHTNRSQPSGFGRQFVALFGKRFANSKRDTRTQVFQIWMPIACLLLAMLLSLATDESEPGLLLDPRMYNTDVETPYSDCDNFTDPNIWDAQVTQHPDLNQVNATESSLSLQASFKSHALKRYTFLHCANSGPMAAHFNYTIRNITVPSNVPLVMHNTTGLHALPEAVQMYYRMYNKINYNTSHNSNVWNKPMDVTPREQAIESGITSLIIGIFIMIPFTFIPSTFVSYVVKERECKAKHAQLISGMHFVTYWVSNFCFDIVCFIGTNLLAIIVFLIFDRTEYIGGAEEFGGIFVLFLFYAASGVTGAYFCSFAFDNHASAQNVTMLGNFVAGFMLVIAVWFFKFFPDTKDAGEILPFIVRIIPSYCLGEGILNMASRDLFGLFGDKIDVFDMDCLGWNITYMAIEVPLFMGLSLLLDHPARALGAQKLFHKPDEKPDPIEGEDDAVARERAEVESGARSNDLVLVQHLRKVYPGKNKEKVAVKNLTFGVKSGEVFGFLGTNGAGKTSAMSILCGEQLPNMGRGFVGGFDVVDQATEARRVVGYCPQFDATLDLLSADEHLHLYAGLRGIEPSKVDDVVNSLILKAGLTPHRKTLAMNMSGGNRRKLSVAIALLGAPAVVILDEPSAGMDPMARRQLWEVIQALAAKCAVVLTTHHLEEVEALANRVTIMVDGTLRCIGSLQELKHKFGSGFEMSIRVKSEDRCEDMREFMRSSFPDAKEEEFRQKKFTFSLPFDTKLSETFRAIEQKKEDLGVTDYSISQTSLEQVFLRIGAEADHIPEHEE